MDGPSPIDVDKNITSKNITEQSTIELLRNIMLSKNKEMEFKQQTSTSTSPSQTNEVYLNFHSDIDEFEKDESNSINDSNFSFKQ
jgi:hypothetical protein